jgi:hypothetical protein
VRVESGWPYSRIVQAVVPPLDNQTFFYDNVDGHRSDTVSMLDIRIDKSFPLGRFKVSTMLDVFNVLNSNAVTNFVLTNGANFGRIIAALDPRTTQATLRLAF